jgi:cystathionine beta-lyase
MNADLPVAPLAELTRRRSAKWSTHPGDVLPLTVAEMDFGLAPSIKAALQAALDGDDTGYSAAVPGLGLAYARFAEARLGWTVDPEAVTAITDVGVGVVEVLRVVTRPGDAVVISPPVYPPFFDWTGEARVHLREVPLTASYRLDLAALERAFAEHPAAYLLCNPQNPVGRVHTADELAALVRLARIYRVTLISDEIHAPLALPGATVTPLLTVPGAAELAIAVVSASKAFNLAGLKCAAVVTAADRMAEVVRRFPPDARWRTGHLGVIASIAAFTDGDDWLDRLLATLARRRDQLTTLLAERLPQLSWAPPEATYLAWLDTSKIGPDDTARELFLDRGRVALEPGLRFGAAGAAHVRLNFGTAPEIIDEATRRMAAALAG